MVRDQDGQRAINPIVQAVQEEVDERMYKTLAKKPLERASRQARGEELPIDVANTRFGVRTRKDQNAKDLLHPYAGDWEPEQNKCVAVCVLGMSWPVPLLGYLLGWVGCDDFHQIGVPVFDSFVCLVCLFVLPRFAHPVNLPPFFCLSIGGCFRALYRKSHGSYEPGEQKRRDIPLPPEVRAQIPKHQRGKRLGLPLCEYLLDFTDSPSTCLELLS